MILALTFIVFWGMVRPKEEETWIKSFSLPGRVWSLFEEASAYAGKKPNNILWRLVEDYLVSYGYLIESFAKPQGIGSFYS